MLYVLLTLRLMKYNLTVDRKPAITKPEILPSGPSEE